MPRLPFVLLPIVGLSLTSALPAQVFLTGDNNAEGQGILRPRSGECFVLAPKHVLKENTEASIVAEFRREAKARVEMIYDEDLAILRVNDTTPINCTEAWDGASRLQDRLETITEGVLETRISDGSLQRHFVRVTSHDLLTMRIRAIPPDRLFEKLSGSVLRLGGTPAGMLIQVDTMGVGGIVLRTDHMTDLVRSFFDVHVAERPIEADGFTIEAMDARYIVSVGTRLFTKPDQLAATTGHAAVEVGTVLRVTGRVRERPWYRVTLNDGSAGFVRSESVTKF